MMDCRQCLQSFERCLCPEMAKPAHRKLDLNTVARKVCKLEGGKVNLSIAQAKEVMRCFMEVTGMRPKRRLTRKEISEEIWKLRKPWSPVNYYEWEDFHERLVSLVMQIQEGN